MRKSQLLHAMHNEHDKYMALSTLARERTRTTHDIIMAGFNQIWKESGYAYIRLTSAELILEKQKQDKESKIDLQIAIIRKQQEEKHDSKFKIAQERKMHRYAIAEQKLYDLLGIA